MNGGLPEGTTKVPRALKIWRAFAKWSPWFPIGKIENTGCAVKLSPAEIAAYDAPFPNSRYTMAARLLPSFIPTTSESPESVNNQTAWKVLQRWQYPFRTLFSSRDPITRGGEKPFLQLVPGAAKQPHSTTRSARHCLQENSTNGLHPQPLQHCTMNTFLKANLIGLYLLAIASLLVDLPWGSGPWIQRVTLIILAAHAAETLIFLRHVKAYRGPLVVSIGLSLLYGLLHWFPIAQSMKKSQDPSG